MELKKTRQQAINELVISDINVIIESVNTINKTYINHILLNGHKGYLNMTNHELEIEYNMMLNLQGSERFEIISTMSLKEKDMNNKSYFVTLSVAEQLHKLNFSNHCDATYWANTLIVGGSYNKYSSVLAPRWDEALEWLINNKLHNKYIDLYNTIKNELKLIN